MKCGYCDRTLDEIAKFCTYCGSMLQEGMEEGGVEPIVSAPPLTRDGHEPIPERRMQIASMDAISFRTVNYGARGYTPRPNRRQRNTVFSDHG